MYQPARTILLASLSLCIACISDAQTSLVAPANKTDWEKRKLTLRTCVSEMLALNKLAYTSSAAIINAARNYNGYSVANFALETVPGLYVCGSVYKPLSIDKKLPLILAPNGHFAGGRYTADEQYLCANLARMGAIAVSYDLFGWGESRLQVREQDHYTATAMKVQLMNARLLLNYFLALPNIDSSRVAITGASGGGSQSILNTALDDRIKVSAPVVMLSADFPGGCACESGIAIRDCAGGTNNAELAAMAAPRPQLIVSCGADWTKNVPVKEYPYLQKMYALFDRKANVSNVHLPNEEHNFGIKKREPVYRFLAKELQLDIRASDESKCTIEKEQLLYSFGENGEKLPSNSVKGIDAVNKLMEF